MRTDRSRRRRLGRLGPAFSPAGRNPFFKALLEQLSGQRLCSGAPIGGDEGLPLDLPARGVAALVLADVAEQLPQVQLFRGPRRPTRSATYARSSSPSLGAPVKTLGRSEAHKRARQEAAR